MNSYRNNPDGEDNQRETKQNDAEIFALNMMERNKMNDEVRDKVDKLDRSILEQRTITKEDLKEMSSNVEIISNRLDEAFATIRELRLENDILRKMNEATRQYNEQLLEDSQEMQACTGLPELKPITTELLPSPSPIAPYPKGRWQHL